MDDDTPRSISHSVPVAGSGLACDGEGDVPSFTSEGTAVGAGSLSCAGVGCRLVAMSDWFRLCGWLVGSGALLYLTLLIVLPIVD